jgi:hypothetical protein
MKMPANKIANMNRFMTSSPFLNMKVTLSIHFMVLASFVGLFAAMGMMRMAAVAAHATVPTVHEKHQQCK